MKTTCIVNVINTVKMGHGECEGKSMRFGGHHVDVVGRGQIGLVLALGWPTGGVTIWGSLGPPRESLGTGREGKRAKRVH